MQKEFGALFPVKSHRLRRRLRIFLCFLRELFEKEAASKAFVEGILRQLLGQPDQQEENIELACILVDRTRARECGLVNSNTINAPLNQN